MVAQLGPSIEALCGFGTATRVHLGISCDDVTRQLFSARSSDVGSNDNTSLIPMLPKPSSSAALVYLRLFTSIHFARPNYIYEQIVALLYDAQRAKVLRGLPK